MSAVVVVGVDPGPTPGFCGLLISVDRQITDVQLGQVSEGLIETLLAAYVQPWRALDVKVLIGVERFVSGHRAARSSTAGAGRVTRDMVGVIDLLGRELGATVVQRSASQVKAWATDERLKKAGLEVPSGMRHAKDGARQALFAAVHARHLPDPLSKTYRKPQL